MDNLPQWAMNVLYAALGGLGAMFAGLIRAKVDNNRIRVDDRAEFTKQVMDRLATVEASLESEREYCERKLAGLHDQYEGRLATRDKVIADLRERIQHLESRLDGHLH